MYRVIAPLSGAKQAAAENLGASPPGGSVDVLARMVADVLRADFSPAVVETQSGAGGRISLNMTAIT